MPQTEPVDRFVLAVEQLQLCRELLLDGSPAKARMGVILLDGLADALLYRRLERLYRGSDEDFLGRTPYTKEVRRQARNDFGLRLRLCGENTYDSFVTGGGGPLVTAEAGVVLRVGHSYRNAAYHRDRHNPATIGAVGRLLFSAVADVFVRSHWLGHSSSVADAEAERLTKLGVPLHGRGSITWRDAAAAVTHELASGLDVPHEDLVELLLTDLEERTAAIEELAEGVPGDADDLDALMASLEFEDMHGSDEELLELRYRRDPVRRAVSENIEVTQALKDEALAADRRYNERLAELGRGWRARATLRTLDDVNDIAAQIAEEPDTLEVLTMYQEIDGKLDVLEDYLIRAVLEIDRYEDMQFEAMRGR